MPWQFVMAAAALPVGETRHFPRPGGEFLVCRTESAVHALDNECPHAGGPLAMGSFSPPLLACPWHAWEFDCRTGECVHSAKARIAVYPVDLREGEIWVNLPDSPDGDGA